MSTTLSSNHEAGNFKEFVHEIGYRDLQTFLNMMDMDDQWKNIAGEYLKLPHEEIYRLEKRVKSPMEELIIVIRRQMIPLRRVYRWLYKMQHYRAMTILEKYLNPKDRINIPSGDTTTGITVIENPPNKSVATPKRSHEAEQPNLQPLTSIPQVKYTDIVAATNNWSESNKIGSGGYGVVYKGSLRGTMLAFKRIESQRKKSTSPSASSIQPSYSIREITCLNESRHENILPLHGYCEHEGVFIVVYPLMQKGSLYRNLLKNPNDLNWSVRLKIAKGTARGLLHLHSMTTKLIHGDIKSDNILLDEHFEPKIGDFGLTRPVPSNAKSYFQTSRAIGTKPYLPPEYIMFQKASPELDVYSFGVILFELATNLKPYDKTKSKQILRDLIHEYDPSKIYNLFPKSVQHSANSSSLFKLFIELGKECTAIERKMRPDMENVYKKLDAFYLDITSPLPSQNYYLNTPQPILISRHSPILNHVSQYTQNAMSHNQILLPTPAFPQHENSVYLQQPNQISQNRVVQSPCNQTLIPNLLHTQVENNTRHTQQPNISSLQITNTNNLLSQRQPQQTIEEIPISALPIFND